MEVTKNVLVEVVALPAGPPPPPLTPYRRIS